MIYGSIERHGSVSENGGFGGLKVYLEVYKRGLPADTRRVFAKNFAVNAVCAYYAEKTRKFDIEYDVILDMPECLPVSEPEVCALLRNLLENAVERCRDVPKPFIRLRGSCKGNHVVITVDNPYRKYLVWEDERLLSSNHEGFGIGTRVVREMTERCGGAAEFGCKDRVFFASVTLYGRQGVSTQ